MMTEKETAWPTIKRWLERCPKWVVVVVGGVCILVLTLKRWLERWSKWVVVVVVVVGVLCILGLILYCGETLGSRIGYKASDGLSIRARFARDALIAMAALTGLVMAGWRNRALEQQARAATEQATAANATAQAALENAKNAQNQSELDRARYASEQFSKGVELLAQVRGDNEHALEARIGGIYALESLAKSNLEKYNSTVMKTLVAYIRNNAQESAGKNSNELNRYRLREDVKTAFSALKNLDELSQETGKGKVGGSDINFNHADFRNIEFGTEIQWVDQVSLWHAQLENADLRWAKLHGASLISAKLHGADLSWAKLHGADFTRAELHGADLYKAELHGADFTNAELHGASLSGAKLHGADLTGAKLHGAKFVMAELHGADLTRAELHGADLSESEFNLNYLSSVSGYYINLPNIKHKMMDRESQDHLATLLARSGLSWEIGGVLDRCNKSPNFNPHDYALEKVWYDDSSPIKNPPTLTDDYDWQSLPEDLAKLYPLNDDGDNKKKALFLHAVRINFAYRGNPDGKINGILGQDDYLRKIFGRISVPLI